jgi:hypothetical protein
MVAEDQRESIEGKRAEIVDASPDALASASAGAGRSTLSQVSAQHTRHDRSRGSQVVEDAPAKSVSAIAPGGTCAAFGRVRNDRGVANPTLIVPPFAASAWSPRKVLRSMATVPASLSIAPPNALPPPEPPSARSPVKVLCETVRLAPASFSTPPPRRPGRRRSRLRPLPAPRHRRAHRGSASGSPH